MQTQTITPKVSFDKGAFDAELAALRAENTRLKEEAAAKIKPLTFKVGEKGGISVYNLNARFPLTLYISQWERLIEAMPKLIEFAKANNAQLKRK